MGFMSLIPTIAGAASSLFGKKKTGGDTVAAQTLLPGYQQESGRLLGDYISKYLGQYEPGKAYDGKFTAGMTDFENTGLTQLAQFLSAPAVGGLYNATEQNLLDTMGGKYANPAESPFINAMVNLSRYNLQDSIDASRRSAGARGNYFSKAAIQDENKLRERSNAGLDAVIGDFVNQERGRQLSAAPLAMALEKYRNQEVPLSKINASQTYGSLPRVIEQSDLESKYQDFQRKQNELSALPGQAQSLFSTNTPYVPSYTNPVIQKNTTLGNILDIISKANVGGAGGSTAGIPGIAGPVGGSGGNQGLLQILSSLGGLFG